MWPMYEIFTEVLGKRNQGELKLSLLLRSNKKNCPNDFFANSGNSTHGSHTHIFTVMQPKTQRVFLHPQRCCDLLNKYFSTGEDFTPHRLPAMSADILGCYNRGGEEVVLLASGGQRPGMPL